MFKCEYYYNPSHSQQLAERKIWNIPTHFRDLYYFMDPESYELVPVNASELSDNFKFVKENMVCKILSYKGKVFGVEPPYFVDLEVTDTDPGFGVIFKTLQSLQLLKPVLKSRCLCLSKSVIKSELILVHVSIWNVHKHFIK